MDVQESLLKSANRILKKHGAETAYCDLSLLLQRYDITRREPAGGSMSKRIEQFITERKADGLSPKTLIDYKQQLNRFAVNVPKLPAKITTADIRGYISVLYGRGLKDTTISTVINTLRTFFSWLQAEEFIIKNPMVKIKPLRIDKKRLRKALSREDIERLRDACSTPREKAIFELLYSSGCRLSEVAGLDIADADFSEQTLRVIGKGDKERITFFSPRAKLCLKNYITTRKGDSGAMFTAEIKPYGKISAASIQKIIRRLGDRAGAQRVYPHILRHSFACHALESGMDITIIQQIMGHESLNTTRIYAKTSNTAAKQAYIKLTF